MTKDVDKFFQERLDMYPHFKKIRDRLWSDDGKSRVTVMVGAGFSLNAKKIEDSFNGMALWDDIKKELMKSLSHKGNLGNVDVLDIGQTYVKEYGRTSLDEALKNAIPDNNYEPDSLHFDLLRLPWSDIYTTNYDTLLERSKNHVHERNYQIIYDISDIPNSVQPRIIKLHGSFPANRPFIFTRLDYDNYPVQFSPFVNMVQQSIMETTFLLIGFSGDDPNFSNWTSWVSKNLGEHMPKIYMLGYNQKHRGVELEKKGITLIDFTEIYSKSTNPFNDMYTDVFRFLMNESKEKKNEWPHRQFENIDDFIYNRETYPGWILLPDQIRRAHASDLHTISNHFFDSITKEIDEYAVTQINELLWCFKTFSIPLDYKKQQILETIIDETLVTDKLNINLHGILLTLLKEARLDLNWDKFNKYLLILKEVELTPEHQHLLRYEIIMNFISLNKTNEVLEQLNNWSIKDNDYEWGIQKAILYSNIDKQKEAELLLDEYLEKIRRLLTIEHNSFKLLSLESVILHNLERITNKRGLFSKRFRELRTYNCNTNSELEQTWLSIDEYIYDLGHSVSPGFDPRTKKSNSKLGDFMRQEILDSYAALVAQEKFSLSFIRTKFYLSLKNINIIYPNYSLIKRIYYAVNNNIDEIFTRQFVFFLKTDQLKIIHSIIINTISGESPLVPYENAVEILSRVYFAFTIEDQLILDKLIFEIVGNKTKYSQSEKGLFTRLFHRIVFSKNTSHKKAFYEQLFVVMDNNFLEECSNDFFEPFLSILANKKVSPIKLKFKEELINNLFENFHKESALIRLYYLHQTKSLSIEQEKQLAIAIKSAPSTRLFGYSNVIFQSALEFVIQLNDPVNFPPLMIIETFIKTREIPRIRNNDGGIIVSSAYTDYFNEFSMIIKNTLKITDTIPDALYIEWFDKFLSWWDSQQVALLKDNSDHSWLFHTPEYLLELVHHLNQTILSIIPTNCLDNKLKDRLNVIINQIYDKKLYCFVHLLPQTKRLNLNSNLESDYHHFMWNTTGDVFKNTIISLTSYFKLIATQSINEDHTPLLKQLFEIIKYGSPENRLLACDTIYQTLKNHPDLFTNEDCDFLIKFSNNYLESIINRADEMFSQEEFDLQASISSMVSQIYIYKEGVQSKLDHWRKFIEINRLPEIRINSEYFSPQNNSFEL